MLPRVCRISAHSKINILECLIKIEIQKTQILCMFSCYIALLSLARLSEDCLYCIFAPVSGTSCRSFEPLDFFSLIVNDLARVFLPARSSPQDPCLSLLSFVFAATISTSSSSGYRLFPHLPRGKVRKLQPSLPGHDWRVCACILEG